MQEQMLRPFFFILLAVAPGEGFLSPGHHAIAAHRNGLCKLQKQLPAAHSFTLDDVGVGVDISVSCAVALNVEVLVVPRGLHFRADDGLVFDFRFHTRLRLLLI